MMISRYKEGAIHMENLPMYYARCTDIYIDKYVSFKSFSDDEGGIYFVNVEVLSADYTHPKHPSSLISVKLSDGRALMIQAETKDEADIAMKEYHEYLQHTKESV